MSSDNGKILGEPTRTQLLFRSAFRLFEFKNGRELGHFAPFIRRYSSSKSRRRHLTSPAMMERATYMIYGKGKVMWQSVTPIWGLRVEPLRLLSQKSGTYALQRWAEGPTYQYYLCQPSSTCKTTPKTNLSHRWYRWTWNNPLDKSRSGTVEEWLRYRNASASITTKNRTLGDIRTYT